MTGLDAGTCNFYAKNASDVVARYEGVASPFSSFLGFAFVAGSRVLDVGCGSGRDLSLLLQQGYEAFGVEPVDAMRLEAIRRHPDLAGRISKAALPNIEVPLGGQYDGVLCSAVLMHVPEQELFDTVFNLRSLLRPNGRLLLSLPLTRNEVVFGGRSTDGRLFQTYTADYLQLLLERIGFQQIGRWATKDALGRLGTAWLTQLFELRSAGLPRAVDQIEGILNRDLKVATYKLALFRALSELAIQEPRIATWRSDERVGVPLRRIAEKWLGYYWPIFAAARFFPQSGAEGAGTSNQLQFRKAMLALMAPYVSSGEHGGLGAWQLDQNAGRVDAMQALLQKKALRAIERAIRQGPVRFSGGALETGTVFTFDSEKNQVLMSPDLWRELSLLGHWINDAVILRWAELSARFGQRQGIHAGDVLPLLLAKPEPLRATAVAREIFAKSGCTHCSWSDCKLTDGFVVDHIIPFSLWGSNDLWNLLPVDAKVNGQKSDKLPTSALLYRQQDRIRAIWRLLRDTVPIPFDRQAAQLLGSALDGGTGWEDTLFARLREAVEMAALQRGLARWSPKILARTT